MSYNSDMDMVFWDAEGALCRASHGGAGMPQVFRPRSSEWRDLPSLDTVAGVSSLTVEQAMSRYGVSEDTLYAPVTR